MESATGDHRSRSTTVSESAEPLDQTSLFCSPQLRDPLTVAIGFMVNPGPFRGCCTFTEDVWDQAVYLEGHLPCPYLVPRDATHSSNPSTQSGKQGRSASVPVLTTNLGKLPQRTNHPVKYTLHWVLPTVVPPSVMESSSEGKAILHCLKGGSLKGLRLVSPVKALVVAGLPELWVIGDRCTAACLHVKEIHFTDLLNLVKVGDYWIYHQDAVEKITLSTASEEGARNLEKVVIGRLPKLRTIGSHFLFECRVLTEVTIQNLPSLESVGSHWITTCRALKTVNLSHMPSLTCIGDYFLHACSSLEAVTLSDLPSLQKVGSRWLAHCNALEQIEIHNLPSLELVGRSFLSNCSKLRRATFQELPKLRVVEPEWLYECTTLEAIHLRDLPSLKTIGFSFAAKGGIKEAILEDLPELEVVDRGWLHRCNGLQKVVVERLPKLHTIGHFAMDQCTSLTEVRFANLPELHRIGFEDAESDGFEWLSDSAALVKLVLDNVPFDATKYCPTALAVVNSAQKK